MDIWCMEQQLSQFYKNWIGAGAMKTTPINALLIEAEETDIHAITSNVQYM